MVANEVIKMGRKRAAADSNAATPLVHTLFTLLVSKLNNQKYHFWLRYQ